MLQNFLYIGVIVVSSRVSGIKCKKRRIARAVLVASFGKLGAVMIVTWKYSILHRGMMSFFIYMNNVIAIKECLETSYFKAFTFVVVAVVVSSIESTIKDYGINQVGSTYFN